MKRPPRYDLPNAAPGALRLVQLFLNTSDHETGRELLATPTELAAWFSGHGRAVDRAGAPALRRARELREELRRLVAGGGSGPALAAAARRARLTVDLEEPRLVPEAPGIDGALGAVVAAIYDAMRDGRWSRLKACRNCGWIYWDTSKNRSGVWCSMQLCGSRLKVHRYRSRQQAGR
jgi:predicted RNA-binding Zn ribbon-like protein